MKARLASFTYALAGLAHMMLREPNARIHFALTIFAIAVSAILGLSREDWRWILLLIALVWMAEIINTAIEHLADTVHPERAEGIRIAKDLAAGAVLVAATAAAVLGIMTFWPYLFA